MEEGGARPHAKMEWHASRSRAGVCLVFNFNVTVATVYQMFVILY